MKRTRAKMLLVAPMLLASCSHRPDGETLADHRNLGKALYENPTTQEEAVREFKAALDIEPHSAREKLNYALALFRTQGHEQQAVKLLEEVQQQDPSLPHTWFNLGIAYKRRGDTQHAIQQFEGFLRRAPSEPVGHFQLGTLYRQKHRDNEALTQFTTAADLDPQMAAPRFQLFDMSRRMHDAAQTSKYQAEFEQIKAIQKTWVMPEDVEWCQYAEIYDPPEQAPETPVPQTAFVGTDTLQTVDRSTAGLSVIDLDGKGNTDLLVWSASGITVYRHGRDLASSTGLEGLKGVIFVAAGDFDNDGLIDLCVLTAGRPKLFRNEGGHFREIPTKLPQGHFLSALWVDYDHDYDLDLVLLGTTSALVRNQGPAGWLDVTNDFPFLRGEATSGALLRVVPDSKAWDISVGYNGRAPALYRDRLGGRYTVEEYKGPTPARKLQLDADFTGTGRIDRVQVDDQGAVQYLRAAPASNRHWIRIQLKGVRSEKLAQGALVEVKAGTFYRRAFYNGVPETFDTGEHGTIDVIRITWPNGLIQNEIKKAADQTHRIEEAQRLSGSCPMIWCWNGREFEFVTDVLGVAPLGARAADGSYFSVNHEEFVRIPASQLRQSNGFYNLRITEELSEVSYLDQIQLFAVDHPSGIEIFTNDKFKSPPFPEPRLYRLEHRIHPVSARTDRGEDVLPLVVAQDQRYPTGFDRNETGMAALHTLELDFGDAASQPNAALVLNGWVDWPDGSTFRRASQESSGGLIMPYLQALDDQGRWQTINADMGMPAGKPKTIVVPVVFPSAKRILRIVTNLCVYWDEISLSTDMAVPSIQPRLLPLDSATLRYRGFSASHVDKQRLQPDRYIYPSVSPVSFWNPTSGFYTRFGRVDELLREADDRMVIMGSGDELALGWKVSDTPQGGLTRDFLLKVDGWAKDSDPNTAFSETVTPLPFHGMSRYPYPSNEKFPQDRIHQEYERRWNTRAQNRPARPLN